MCWPLVLVVALLQVHLGCAKLLAVQMLGRHGTRAPKASLQAVCPTYSNWEKYDVGPEGARNLHVPNVS